MTIWLRLMTVCTFFLKSYVPIQISYMIIYLNVFFIQNCNLLYRVVVRRSDGRVTKLIMEILLFLQISGGGGFKFSCLPFNIVLCVFPIYLDRKWPQYPWLAHGENFSKNRGTVLKQVRHDKNPSPLKAATADLVALHQKWLRLHIYNSTPKSFDLI